MATLTFDTSKITRYGLYGQEAMQNMHEALQSHSLKFSYFPDSAMFVILGSSAFKKEQIEEIFAQKSYRGWAPKVLDRVDEKGNRLVKLGCLDVSIEDPSRFLRASATYSPGLRCRL